MLEKLKEGRDFILVICIFLLTICTLELGYLVGLERNVSSSTYAI